MSSVWNTAESLLFGSSDVSEERSSHSHQEADTQQDEQSQEFSFQNISSSGGGVAPASSNASYSRDDLPRTSFTNATSSKAKILKGRHYSASKGTSPDFGSTGINVICTTPSENLSHENYDIVGIDNSSGNSYLSNSNSTSGSNSGSFIGSEPIESSNSQFTVSLESSNCLMTSAASSVASHVTVGSGNNAHQSSGQSSASVSTGFIPSFEEVKKQISYTEKKRKGRVRGASRRAGNSLYTRKRTKNLGDRKETLAVSSDNHPVDNTQFLNNYDNRNDDGEQLDNDSNVEVDEEDDDEEEDENNEGAEPIDVCGDDTEQNFTTGHNSTSSDGDDEDDDDNDDDEDDDDDVKDDDDDNDDDEDDDDDDDDDEDDDDDDDDPVDQTFEANVLEQHQGSSLLATHTKGVLGSKEFLGTTFESDATTLFGNSAPSRGGRGVGRPRGSRGSGRGRGRGYLPPAVAEGLARHRAVQQKVYKMKYKHMKSFARSLVLENAALCDLVSDVQQKIVLANEKRRFLLKKLHSVMLTTPGQNKENPFQQFDNSALSLLDGRSSIDPSNNGNMFASGTASTATSNSSDSYNASGGGMMMVPGGGGVTNAASNNAMAMGDRSRSHQHVTQRKTRGGRRGAGGVGKSKRLCPPITLDSAGRPLFPICLGPLTIHSLGEIVSERSAYHRVHVIYPVGFCSSRTYASVTRPSQAATYTCKILDSGNVPRFELVCEEPETGEERVFSGSSPSECHNMVLAAINSAAGMPKGVLQPTAEVSSISDRGLRFFGLSHPSVQNVLQACPGARKCVNYQWIKFEVCRSESEVDKVLETERDTGLCHETLLRNIRFAAQAL